MENSIGSRNKIQLFQWNYSKAYFRYALKEGMVVTSACQTFNIIKNKPIQCEEKKSRRNLKTGNQIFVPFSMSFNVCHFKQVSGLLLAFFIDLRWFFCYWPSSTFRQQIGWWRTSPGRSLRRRRRRRSLPRENFQPNHHVVDFHC